MQVKYPDSSSAERLEEAVHDALAGLDYEVRRMFGGKTFMLNGNMLCCVSVKGLMSRVGADAESEALAMPHAQPCMGTGRRMAGFILVDYAGLSDQTDIAEWVDRALAYVGAMPPKTAAAKSMRKTKGSQK